MDMKKLAGDKAAEYVKDGMVVGLGTGSTAYHMVNAVGEMVKNGLKIQAIPTSKATEAQARELGIPLLTIDELDHVDLAIDGVDEIDPQFNAIKGGGGALYWFKLRKPKADTRGADDLDDYDYGEDDTEQEDEDPWETEESDEPEDAGGGGDEESENPAK